MKKGQQKPAIESKEVISSGNGVNLIGYFRSENGLGEACRMTAATLSSANIPWGGYDYEVDNPSHQDDHTWDHRLGNSFPYDISIFRLNADHLQNAFDYLPASGYRGYRIGIWDWELEHFPGQWHHAFDLVDEIWVSTSFVQKAIQEVSPVPIYVLPPGITAKPTDPQYDRKFFDLPKDAFLFLNFFDVFSMTSRKNPGDAIRAFQKAFAPDDKTVGLVLKINNATSNDGTLVELQKLIGNYQNIYVIARTLPKEQVNALMQICDAAVSLHHSEGFGLLCLEAMAYGKPVVATNYSGNTDFMTPDNSCLVDYQIVPVADYYGVVNNDDRYQWAQPDISQASEYLKRLYSDPDFAKQIGPKAAVDIATNYAPLRCGQAMLKRLQEIWQSRPSWSESHFQDAYSRERQRLNTDLSAIYRYKHFAYYRDELDRITPINIIKKIIRKSIGFLFAPIEIEQTRYNEANARMIAKLTTKLTDMENQIQELNQKNQILEMNHEYDN